MFNIDKNNKITITKGDTGNGLLFVNCGTKDKPVQYILKETDTIFFYLFKIGNETPILTKQFTVLDLDSDNNVKIRFESADTNNLTTQGCEYVYSIKIHINNDTDVSTIINKTAFILEF